MPKPVKTEKEFPTSDVFPAAKHLFNCSVEVMNVNLEEITVGILPSTLTSTTTTPSITTTTITTTMTATNNNSGSPLLLTSSNPLPNDCSNTQHLPKDCSNPQLLPNDLTINNVKSNLPPALIIHQDKVMVEVICA
jgi:hypothetical protein